MSGTGMAAAPAFCDNFERSKRGERQGFSPFRCVLNSEVCSRLSSCAAAAPDGQAFARGERQAWVVDGPLAACPQGGERGEPRAALPGEELAWARDQPRAWVVDGPLAACPQGGERGERRAALPGEELAWARDEPRAWVPDAPVAWLQGEDWGERQGEPQALPQGVAMAQGGFRVLPQGVRPVAQVGSPALPRDVKAKDELQV